MDQDYVAIDVQPLTSTKKEYNNTPFLLLLLTCVILFIGLLLFIWYVSV